MNIRRRKTATIKSKFPPQDQEEQPSLFSAQHLFPLNSSLQNMQPCWKLWSSLSSCCCSNTSSCGSSGQFTSRKSHEEHVASTKATS